jgi:hypothetical protein
MTVVYVHIMSWSAIGESALDAIPPLYQRAPGMRFKFED